MSSDFYNLWAPVVVKTARSVARDFPDVEEDDLSQDLYVFILEKGFSRPSDGGVTQLLRNHARSRAMEYRAEHLILSPQYNYRVSDVRRILEHVFDHEDWVRSGSFAATDDDGLPLPTQPTNREASYDISDTLIEYSDVKRAWQRLSHEYRKVLFERFGLGTELDRGSAAEKRMYRALARLTDNLNSYHPSTSHSGPGARRLLTSAHERFLISQQV